ncbi:Fur family transcriptional regulator [Enterococcus sp. DIV0876]|uniref:Fur family transcriptional regulator n=1 Tax=Enterococcus sp. DIV0876 TaxID=2774633 RepID=UPI003D2FDFF9
MRMTKQRKAIIDLFGQNDNQALNADMIHNMLGNEEMNLSTVYRNMDKLTELGLVQRIIINTVAYYCLANSTHRHFMLCTNCKKLIPIHCFLKKMLPALEEENDFSITSHDMTILGLCHTCKNIAG